MELAKDASDNKKQLLELADQILYNLSSFQGSVLDNEPLIQVLNESKKVSTIIKQKEVESAATREEIARYYALYNPIGVRAVLIYFLISDMSMVEPMYLFSLGYYKQLVQQEIKKIDDFRGDQEMIEKRVSVVIEKMTFDLFTSISRGLFEKDKTVFSFLLGCRIYQRAGMIRPEEWSLFVKNQIFADIYLSDPINTQEKPQDQMVILKKVEENPLGLSDKIVSMLKVMGHVRYLNNLAQLILEYYETVKGSIIANKSLTADIINYMITLDEKQASSIPEIIVTALHKYETTAFQRLIFVRLLAEEYFYLAVPQFIEQLLDQRYASIKP